MVKINKKDDFVMTETVELTPAVSVTINSLPYDFDDMMREALPTPVAPLRALKDEFGKFIYKDKKSKRVQSDHDENDPKYLEAVAVTTMRQAAFMVYHGTVRGESFEWDSDINAMDVPEFCDAINAELRDIGIGKGYVMQLVQDIMKISGFDEKKVEEAQAAFLSTEMSET